MEWERISKWGIKSGDYSIGKYSVLGKISYVLFFQKVRLMQANSANQLKQFAERHHEGNQGII